MLFRSLKDGGPDPTSRVAWLVRTVTGRQATDRERTILNKLYATVGERYAADPAAARALVVVGDTKPDPAVPAVDLAAAAGLAQAVLTHDAAVTRR